MFSPVTSWSSRRLCYPFVRVGRIIFKSIWTKLHVYNTSLSIKDALLLLQVTVYMGNRPHLFCQMLVHDLANSISPHPSVTLESPVLSTLDVGRISSASFVFPFFLLPSSCTVPWIVRAYWRHLIICSVQFKMVCAREGQYALQPVSLEFPQCCPWNSSNVRLKICIILLWKFQIEGFTSPCWFYTG